MENENAMVHAPTNGAGMVARQEFGATQVEKRAETSATAVAAQARAEIEARYSMALARPRNMNAVRVRLLEECKRPLFAAVARYAKPVGKKKNEETGRWEQAYARGFSVRFAESAARCMGNLLITVKAIYDDASTRILHVAVSDLDANVTAESDVVVEKVVERKQPREGQRVIRQRVNSYGDPVFLVEASDDELLVKSAALVAKARRNLIMQMIPGDIQDECLAQIEEVLADPKAVDPTQAKKKLIDAFAQLGVMPEALDAYLDHPIAASTPAEIEDLRQLYVALRDGETTWKQVMDGREVIDAPATTQQDKAKPPRTTADLKERERAKGGAQVIDGETIRNALKQDPK